VKLAITDLPQPVYIAGPMTGLPRFNYPAFAEAEELIAECGVSVFNPTKLVNTADEYDEIMASVDGTYNFSNGKTWSDFIIPSVKVIIDRVGSLVFLKDWQTSRGARLEAVVAHLCGKPCYTYPHLVELTAVDIATTLVPDDLFDGDNDGGE
jgi:hypothetical protein